jgi:hypothetical protein
MNNLTILMNGVFGRKVPAEFAAADYDYEAALRDELTKLLCDEKGRFSRTKYRRNKIELFELLEQNLEEVLPQNIQNALDMFCEVIRVPQGSRLEFRVTRGKQRGRQFVTRATESGNYETFRLDRDRFDVYPQAIGGAGYVDFERYLDGVENMTDIYEVIQQGIVDRIFEMVQEVLLNSWNLAGRPAKNKVIASSFDPAAMVKLVNVIRAYGDPIIYCSPEFAAEMVNAIVYNNTTKISDQDMVEVRERGYIGKFRGTPVVVMPQSYTDEKNEKLVMNPSFAYVIPAGKEKLIKLGFEGSPYFREWDDHEGDNQITLQGYLKVGVGMVGTPNYWGIYYNAGIEADGWKDFNDNLDSAIASAYASAHE